MAMRLANTTRTSRVDVIRADIDAGAGAGRLKIYDGVKPAKGSPPAGTLLADLELADPCGVSAAGVLTFTTPFDDPTADASGTAVFFVLEDSTGAFVADGDIATSGADLNLVTVSIVATQPIVVSSFTITDGSV